MADPRKKRHVFETDVKNRLRSAREAVGDAVSLLEEAGADPDAAREKVLSSLGRPEFEEDRLEALADALDRLGAWKGSLSVRAMAEDPLKKTAKLSWPFPAAPVLKDLHSFINYALGQTMPDLLPDVIQGRTPQMAKGRQGEVQAARELLWKLRKTEAPMLAYEIQQEWKRAARAGDRAQLARLRRWWAGLRNVLVLLRRMGKLINKYEKSKGHSHKPGYMTEKDWQREQKNIQKVPQQLQKELKRNPPPSRQRAPSAPRRPALEI